MKKIVKILMIAFIGIVFCQSGFSENPDETKKLIVKGKVQEIASDCSFIVVAESKIFIDADFLKNNPLTVGNEVEVMTIPTENGLKAMNTVKISKIKEVKENS